MSTTSVFDFLSSLGMTLLNVSEKLFRVLTSEVNSTVPIIGGYSLLDIAFIALPIIFLGVLIYKFVTG